MPDYNYYGMPPVGPDNPVDAPDEYIVTGMTAWVRLYDEPYKPRAHVALDFCLDGWSA